MSKINGKSCKITKKNREKRQGIYRQNAITRTMHTWESFENLVSLSDPLSAISLLVEQKQIVHNDHRDLSSCTTSSHTVYMSFHIYLIFNEAVNTHSVWNIRRLGIDLKCHCVFPFVMDEKQLCSVPWLYNVLKSWLHFF